MELQCDFVFNSNGEYECRVSRASILQRCELKSLRGAHATEKTIYDVKVLKIENTLVHYLPSGLSSFFPRLEKLVVRFCGLKEISRSDLFGLEHLRYLWINLNDLKSLPDFLFVHNKRIKSINFSFNDLEFMSSRMLDSIPENQLEFVSFEKNACIDAVYWPESEVTLSSVRDLKTEIDSKCSSRPIDFPIMTRTNTKEFKDFWRDEDFRDFSIIVGERKILVHKVFLAAKTGLFSSTQKNRELLKTSEKLKIEDCSEEAVKEFFHALYTGKIETCENAFELFSLASVFDVPELKSAYQEIAISSINEHNAVEALKVGNLQDCQELIEIAFSTVESFLSRRLDDDLKYQPKIVEKILETFASRGISPPSSFA